MSLINKVYYEIKTLMSVYLVKISHWKSCSVGKLPYFKGCVDVELSSNGTLKLGNRIKIMGGQNLV